MHLHACSAYQHVGVPCGDDGEASIWLGCNFKLQQNKTWYGLAMYLTSPNYAHKISIHKLKHQFPTTEATFFDRASFYSDQYNTVTHIDLQYTEINTQWFNTRDQYNTVTHIDQQYTEINTQRSIHSDQYTEINTQWFNTRTHTHTIHSSIYSDQYKVNNTQWSTHTILFTHAHTSYVRAWLNVETTCCFPNFVWPKTCTLKAPIRRERTPYWGHSNWSAMTVSIAFTSMTVGSDLWFGFQFDTKR